jgi:hypothetical protein
MRWAEHYSIRGGIDKYINHFHLRTSREGSTREILSKREDNIEENFGETDVKM